MNQEEPGDIFLIAACVFFYGYLWPEAKAHNVEEYDVDAVLQANRLKAGFIGDLHNSDFFYPYLAIGESVIEVEEDNGGKAAFAHVSLPLNPHPRAIEWRNRLNPALAALREAEPELDEDWGRPVGPFWIMAPQLLGKHY